MTKKARRRLDGLLAPRRPKRWKALDADYGRHVLDATLEEIQPAVRPQPADEPSVKADHLLARSELAENLQAMFDEALARSGALNSDEDLPDYSALAEEANLSLAEYEAVALSIDGWGWEDVAKFQKVNPETSRSAFRRGLTKIRQFILISAKTGFPGSVLRGHLGGDEA